MPVKIKCPNCGAALTAPDEALGKKGRCKQCNTVIEVAAVPATLPSPTAEPGALHDPVFGKLQRHERLWKGTVRYAPQVAPIAIVITAGESGPTQADRDWYRDLEKSHPRIVEKVAEGTRNLELVKDMTITELRLYGLNKYDKYCWSL